MIIVRSFPVLSTSMTYFVRDVLFDTFKQAGVGGKHACGDLTRVSPLVGLGVETLTVG